MRAHTLSGADPLILSFLDDDVDSDNWLLEALHAFCEELFDLGVSGEQLGLCGVLDALEQNVDIQLVLESLTKNISHKRNHLWLLALDLQLYVRSLLIEMPRLSFLSVRRVRRTHPLS